MAEAPETDLGALFAQAIGQGIAAAFGQVSGTMSGLTGTAPIAGQDEAATLGGSMSAAQWEAVMSVVSDRSAGSPGYWTDFMGGMVHVLSGFRVGEETPTWLQAADQALNEGKPGKVFGAIFSGLLGEAKGVLSGWMAGGPIAPEKAWERALSALGATSAMGLTAHGLSTVLSMKLFGCGGLQATGMAAVVAQAAGFGPIVNAVVGQAIKAYLAEPMGYHVNSLFRPNIPGVGELLRFRSKRLLPGAMGFGGAGNARIGALDQTPLPGFNEFKKYLAYHGYSDEWAAVFENDLYAEPRQNELAIMGECEQVPPEWWWRKCRALGYEEADAGYMVEGIQRKVARSWIEGVVNELIKAYAAGIIDQELFLAKLRETRVAPLTLQWAWSLAEWRRYAAAIADAGKLLVDEFNRDLITVDDLRDGLAIYYADPGVVESMVRRETVRKYRTVKWTSVPEAMQKAIGEWRKRFVAGAITESEYLDLVVTAGVEPAAADIMLELDKYKRDQTVAAEWRRYELPLWRDKLAQGLVTAAEYRRALEAAGFPAAQLNTEVAVAEALAKRRREQRVERYMLPYYEEAYILGLIGGDLVRQVMIEAGLSPAERIARGNMLDYKRAHR